MPDAMFRSFLTIFYVADLERSLRVYRDVCGFEETYRFPREGPPEHVELKLGNALIGFADLKGQMTHRLSPPVPGQMAEIAIQVSDADAAFERLEAAGLIPLVALHDTPSGHRVGYLLDPDGHRIQIGARRK
jgi:catechol 2,3-dioxygenase-like lactoylglutathione lyase family enzyme